MDGAIVHPRVSERHPELSDADVLSAWNNALTTRHRLDNAGDRLIALGADSGGHLIEMVANQLPDGTWVIFHAMTPPSHNTLIELGMVRR